MPAITTVVKVDSIGRVIIPKHLREALRISRGDLVKITVEKEDVQVVGEEGNAEALPIST
jgi:AbrB family looped-hinge helix DNA binding protein